MMGARLAQDRESGYMSNVTRFVLTVLTVLLFAACSNVDEKKREHLHLGKSLYEAGDLDKAHAEFTQLLALDNGVAEGFYYLGLIAEKRQNWREAFTNLRRAVEIDPAHSDANIRIGRLYLLGRQADQAVAAADSVLAREPENPRALTLKAAAVSHLGDWAQALRLAESAYQLDPGSEDTISLLALIYERESLPEKAISFLEQGIRDLPRSVPLRLQLANAFSERKEFDRAEALFQELVALAPEQTAYRAQLAQFYAELGQLDQAEKVLWDAITADPDDESRRLLLAEFLVAKRSAQVAEKELLAFLEEEPGAFSVRFRLARLYESANELDRAEQAYRDIIKLSRSGPDNVLAKNKLALILMDKGRKPEAQRLITEILEESPANVDALGTRGRMALADRDAAGAIRDFEKVLSVQPGAVAVLGNLADAYLANNEPDKAREVLRGAIAAAPGALEPRYALINMLMATQDFAAADQIARELLAVSPGDRQALKIIVDLSLAKQDWAAATTTAEAIIRTYPAQALGYFKLGETLERQGKIDAAIKQYLIAVEKAPEAFETNAAVVRGYLATNHQESAMAHVQRFIKAYPASAGAYDLLGEVYVYQGKEKEAIAAFRKAINLNPKQPEPYKNLTGLYTAHGDLDSAIAVYKEALAIAPGKSQLAMLLAGAYESNGQFDEAMRSYEEIIARNPQQHDAANRLARLLTERRGDPAALRKALDYARAFEGSTNPEYLDTLGWIYYHQGDAGAAIPPLKSAVELAPHIPLLQYHLGMAYALNQQNEAAVTHLRRAVDAGQEFAGLAVARETLERLLPAQ